MVGSARTRFSFNYCIFRYIRVFIGISLEVRELFPQMGQFWVMGVLAGIGSGISSERRIIRDKHTWQQAPRAQWMG